MKRLIIAMLAVLMFASTAYGADCSIDVTVKHIDYWSGATVCYGYITIEEGSCTYPIEGMSLTPAMLGMAQIDDISFTRMSGMYDVLYNSTSTLLFLTQPPGNTTVVTAAPVTTDSDRFIVTDNNDAATAGKLLCVMPVPGASMAQLGILDAMGGTTKAHRAYCFIAAADSATYIAVTDTVESELALLAGPMYGDTLFFDDNATNSYEALFYSGNGLGDMGTLYIPYSNGRVIAVLKKTGAQMYAASAVPLYFDEDGGLDDKILAVCTSNANSDFSADITYTSLAGYAGKNAILPDNTAITSDITYWFLAIGR